MHALLLATTAALAVILSSGAPAMAQSGSNQGLSAANQVRVHRSHVRQFRDDDRDHRRFDRRRHSDFGDDIVIGNYGSYGEWGRYNNRSFDPDSFNDWWHERTWRSYPRWVANRTCDRMWWGGGTWRCSY
jgi:hypothetical protein